MWRRSLTLIKMASKFPCRSKGSCSEKRGIAAMFGQGVSSTAVSPQCDSPLHCSVTLTASYFLPIHRKTKAKQFIGQI